LRIDYERAAEPTIWRGGTPDVLVKVNGVGGGDSETFAKALMNPNATPDSVRAAMIEFYRQMPEQYADQYAVLFKRLAASDAPLLFHCTADRTGIAAALVLTALGAPRQRVIDDYAMSEKVVNYGALLDAPAGATGGASFDALRKLPREVVMPIFRSEPAYIEAALSQSETQYGSVDGYLTKRLGITEAELTTMRARLLQNAA
jgi:protein-tyrosine phosphatase